MTPMERVNSPEYQARLARETEQRTASSAPATEMDERYPVTMKRIVVTQQGEAWHACFEQHPERRAAGGTAEQAIGKLMLNWGRNFVVDQGAA